MIAALARALILSAFVTLSACEDKTAIHYPTRAEAEADHLFLKGVLPRVIPPSTRNITVRSDGERNRAQGEFHFAPVDYDKFTRALEAIPSQNAEPWPPALRQKLAEGYLPFAYIDRAHRWLFFIHPTQGHCLFYL